MRQWRAFAFVVLCGSSVSGLARSNDSADTATLYLRAWSFKDFATMRDLSAPSGQGGQDPARFFSAAGRLPAPAAELRILSRSPRPAASGGGETVYFESSAPGGAAPLRGSIIVGSAGVIHPELMGALAPSSPPAAPVNAAGAPEQKSVGGETAESILQKMNEASRAAKTLRSDVAIRGSMMGTSVNETARLSFKAPGKIRLQAKSFVMNSDGSRSILYLPEANVYMNLADLGEFELTPGIGTSVEEMKEKYEVSLAGKGEVNGEPAYELRLKSPTTAGGMSLGLGQGSGRMTIWISAKTWLPLRASLEGIKVDYQNMQVNAGEIDDSTFDFKPPQGATAFSLGGLLGALGGGGSLPGLDQ